ncbi:hypothetical protein OEZ86_008823 [Tetradesmus obliquus]|nr:hypothetical protein OEZ86_008823 [Tetradesmus obliquus]
MGVQNKEAWVCLRCLPGYRPVRGIDGKSIVQCVCPPGTYQVLSGTSRSCEKCPKGSFCTGGSIRQGSAAAAAPSELAFGGTAEPCAPSNMGLTTKSEGSTKYSDCIALGGFVLPAARGQEAVRCTGNTYAPPANRLRSCLPCQSGLEVPPEYRFLQEDRSEVCRVPPGRFWELNVVRECPRGLYREEYARITDRSAIACRSCPEGWQTSAKGATSKNQCTILNAGYMLEGAALNDPLATLPQDADIVDAVTCPIGYYSTGGSMVSCKQCPFNTTTKATGAISPDDCLVPPGYFVKLNDANPAVGVLEKCPKNVSGMGYYRSGWVSFSQAKGTDGTDACTPCGAGILSEYRDADEIQDGLVVMANDPHPGLVPSSSASCYISPGWGMSFDPADFTKFRAFMCQANTYGELPCCC